MNRLKPVLWTDGPCRSATSIMLVMPRIPTALRSSQFAQLTRTQDQIVSRRQLAGHNIGRALIARRVVADRWQVVGPHVVVLHAGPLSRPQQYWAGVLHGGRGAMLGGLTALEVEGFTGFGSTDVLVCAPHGCGRRDLTSKAVTIRVHESRYLPRNELLVHTSPPRLRQERASVDAAACARSDRACRTILAAVVQQRLVTPAMLRSLVLARVNLRRRPLILETLGDIEGGSESLPELDYLRGLARFGLPVPTRQRVVEHPGGRYHLDADFDEWLVTVEINGVQHLTLQHKESDDIRRTRLAIGGRLVVDVGSYTVRHDIELAVLLTADALLSRGWVPPDAVRRRLLTTAAAHPTFTWTSTCAG